MTYTLRLLTAESRDLVVEALRAEASKRTRVASKASLAVAADKVLKRDVRSASVRVTALLAEAAQLEQLADELAAAQDVPVVTGPVPPLAVTDPDLAVRVTDVDPAATLTPLEEHAIEATAEGDLDDVGALVDELGDDGLSPAAHAAMAQAEEYAEAYLADPDGADVDTNAIGEDEPGDDDVEEVLK